MSGTIRVLRTADISAVHALRHRALREVPTAFGASPDEPHETRDSWTRTLMGGGIHGVFDDGGTLIAMAGLSFNPGEKSRHRARMWGVYVAAETQGQGLGRRLLTHLIEAAREQAEWLDASVAADNPGALHLYESLGFERYGTETAALRVDGRDIDLHLLTLKLR